MQIRQMRHYLFLILFVFSFCSFAYSEHPFGYDLHETKIPGKDTKTMICFHGMGGDYHIVYYVKKFAGIDETLIGFNFPDYSIQTGNYKPENTTFGTLQELLPAIYILKKTIVNNALDEVNLYGFSAGGGAIINTLAVLSSSRYDQELNGIGVTQEDKARILAAIQKGTIILDTPLKSVSEIVAFRGPVDGLDIIQKRYQENEMEPIDALGYLKDLSLHIIVHFQNPDTILSNRDDDLFIQRLKEYNAKGRTSVIIGYDRGHFLPHPLVWSIYLQERSMYHKIKVCFAP